MLIAAACDRSTQVPLRIAHNSWPGYEPLPLAESEGLFTGVEVINYRVGSATEVIRAFEQDVVDVAAVTLDEAIAIQSRSKERICIIVVLDISHGGDVIIAKKEITSISDLKGKRIGLESSALGAFFVSRAIDSAPDISLEELIIVPKLYDQHFTSFISGDVDAIVTFEPVKSMILEKKGHVIFDSTAIENEIVDVLITKHSFAEKRSKEIRALVAGYFNTLEFIKKHPDESFFKMAKFEDVSMSSFSKSLSGLRIPDKTENFVLLSGKSPALISTINKLQSFLHKNKIINNNIDAEMLVTDIFLPQRGNITHE
ncbi:MAG: ABC transporter substrate-binding protein [Gammaproteobacteria bacterium]|nr:ABC transporter substrate-binding protein [Gammaproteobacteria bacterium]